MSFVSTIREIAEGFKLGARYAVTEKHGLVEKGVQPRVNSLNAEKFGR